MFEAIHSSGWLLFEARITGPSHNSGGSTFSYTDTAKNLEFSRIVRFLAENEAICSVHDHRKSSDGELRWLILSLQNSLLKRRDSLGFESNAVRQIKAASELP